MDNKKHTRSGSSAGDHQSTDLAEVLKQIAAMMQEIKQTGEKMEDMKNEIKEENKQNNEKLGDNLKHEIAQTSESLENKMAQSSEENRINNEKLGEKIEEKIAENSDILKQDLETKMVQNSDKLREDLKRQGEEQRVCIEIVSQNICQLENKLEEQKIEIKKEMVEELTKLETKLAQHTEEQRQFVNDVICGWEGRLEEYTKTIDDKVEEKCMQMEDKVEAKVEKLCQTQEEKIQKWGKQTEENLISQIQLKEEIREIGNISQHQEEKLGLVENKTVEIQGNLSLTRKELDDIIVQLSKRDDTIKTSIRTEINQLRRQQVNHHTSDTYSPINWVKPNLWPKFKGNGDKIHPLTFLKTILHYTQDINDDLVRLNTIRTVLQDRAMEWAEMTMDKCETVEDFKKAFERQYWGSSQQDRLKIQLMTGRYVEGFDSRENYAIDLFNKCKYLEAFDEPEIAKYLLNHFLLIDQHAIIGQDVKSIDQLIEFLRKLDDLDLAKKRNRMNYRPQNTSYPYHTYNQSSSNAPYNQNQQNNYHNNNNQTHNSRNYNTNNQSQYPLRTFNSYQNGNQYNSNRDFNNAQNNSYRNNQYTNNNGNRNNNTFANNQPRNPGYTNQGNRQENYRPNDRKGPMINNTYIKRGRSSTKPNYFSWQRKTRREAAIEEREEDEEAEKRNSEDEKKKTPILKWRERSPSPTPTTSTQQ